MRRLIVFNLMSLDGFVSGPNGELDWFVRKGFQTNTEFGDYAREQIKSVGAILLGRRTYEEFVSYWPEATDNEPVITERMNNVPKVVFSRTLTSVSWGKWGNIRLVKENAAEEVAKMKQEEGKDLVIYGSATLVSDLMKAGLIDEYRIFLQPIVLGKGRPEFKDLSERYELELVESKQFKTGAIALFYRLAKQGH
ncbi:MAG TPA: dihydrofolate reductase family protein [Nitrososphaerales archaeon]|nr:dihydrofolate reductase family protein [Nitrososphaerales archaeon]